MPAQKTRARCKHCGAELVQTNGTIQPWRHTFSRSWWCEGDPLVRITQPQDTWTFAQPAQEGGNA
jgi:hypothetical protein